MSRNIGLARALPLCPPPFALESLTSWLFRIAKDYALPLHRFLPVAGLDPNLHYAQLFQLNVAAPKAMVQDIAHLSGLTIERIRAMTLAGVVPMVDQPATPDGFRRYLNGFSVLRVAPHSEGSIIRLPTVPWKPTRQSRLVCPDCLLADEVAYMRLTWAMELTITCPTHGLRLVPHPAHAGDRTLNNDGWLQRTPAASEDVLRLDRMTSFGVERGWVLMPQGRRMPVVMWFRLLRSFIDELMRPEEHHEWGLIAGKDFARIWKRAGHRNPPTRANSHTTFEDGGDAFRYVLLRAAAAGVALIMEGEIVPKSSRAQMLCPESVLRSNDRFPDDPQHWLRRQIRTGNAANN